MSSSSWQLLDFGKSSKAKPFDTHAACLILVDTLRFGMFQGSKLGMGPIILLTDRKGAANMVTFCPERGLFKAGLRFESNAFLSVRNQP
jgi:hypothetical protein